MTVNETPVLPGLTPLRGIAAIFVAMLHYELVIAPLWPEVLAPVSGKLYLMVDLFFVLSGFVLYHVYGRHFERSIKPQEAVRYLRARFARVYPLHAATLVALICVAVFASPEGDFVKKAPYAFFRWETLPLQLTMLHGTWAADDAYWNTPSWSISVEWWAYCAFPFLALAMSHYGLLARIVLALAIATTYVWITEVLQPSFWAARWDRFGIDPAAVPYPTGIVDVVAGPAPLRGLAAFALGMLTYWFYTLKLAHAFLKSAFVFLSCWALLIGGWALGVLYDPFAILIMAVMILAAASNDDWLKPLLNARPMKFLGDISYSIYLIHMPILFATIVVQDRMAAFSIGKRSPGVYGFSVEPLLAWCGFGLFLTVILVASSFAYARFERPMRKALGPAT